MSKANYDINESDIDDDDSDKDPDYCQLINMEGRSNFILQNIFTIAYLLPNYNIYI